MSEEEFYYYIANLKMQYTPSEYVRVLEQTIFELSRRLKECKS